MCRSRNISWCNVFQLQRKHQPRCEGFRLLDNDLRMASISHRREDCIKEVKEARKVLRKELQQKIAHHVEHCRTCEADQRPTQIFWEQLVLLPQATPPEAVQAREAETFDLNQEIAMRATKFLDTMPRRAKLLGMVIKPEAPAIRQYWEEQLHQECAPAPPIAIDAVHQVTGTHA